MKITTSLVIASCAFLICTNTSQAYLSDRYHNSRHGSTRPFEGFHHNYSSSYMENIRLRPFPIYKEETEQAYAADAYDTGEVLVSTPNYDELRILEQYTSDKIQDNLTVPIAGRVGDSRQLEEIIKDKKWTFESKQMAEAYEKHPYKTKADPFDYNAMFNP